MVRRSLLRSYLPTLLFFAAFLLATLFPWAISVGAVPLIQEDAAVPPPPAIASEAQFFEEVDVHLVNIDVVVTDKQGRPISGLEREDFVLRVDGEEVELVNFFEVTGSSGTAPDPQPIAADATSEPAIGPAQPLQRVIVVDNRNIRPENRKLLFEKLRQHLAADSPPEGETMLVTLGRKLEIAVPPTADSGRIIAALDELQDQATLHALFDSERRMFLSRLNSASLRPYSPAQADNPALSQLPGSDVGPDGSLTADGDPDFDDAVRRALSLATDVRRLGEKRYQHARATTEALARLCETLGGMPGRKALIYLSDGIPMRPADSLIEAWTGKYQDWVLTSGDDIRRNSAYPEADRTFQQVMSSLSSSEFDLDREIRQLTVRASANRVAFYPISNGGRQSGFVSAAVSGGTISNGSGSGLRAAQRLENFARDASLLVMAEDTGGQALLRTANVGELLDRSQRDFRSFYSLGYRREPAADEPQRRAKPSKIRVEVQRDAAVVRHGKSYQPRHWRDRLGAMTLASALFEVEDNAFGAALDPGEPIPEGKRFRVPIMIRIPFEQIRLVYRDDHFRAQLTAVVVVRDEDDGGFSEPRRIDFPIKIPGRRIMEAAQREAGYLLELEMAEGPKRVAVGIRDHLARTEATLHLDLVVGDSS